MLQLNQYIKDTMMDMEDEIFENNDSKDDVLFDYYLKTVTPEKERVISSSMIREWDKVVCYHCGRKISITNCIIDDLGSCCKSSCK